MRKYSTLEEVISVLYNHGHIKDQVIWDKGIYELEAWTTRDDKAINIHAGVQLSYNEKLTREWIKRGGLKSEAE